MPAGQTQMNFEYVLTGICHRRSRWCRCYLGRIFYSALTCIQDRDFAISYRDDIVAWLPNSSLHTHRWRKCVGRNRKQWNYSDTLWWIDGAISTGSYTEAYSEPCQTTKMERFADIVNNSLYLIWFRRALLLVFQCWLWKGKDYWSFLRSGRCYSQNFCDIFLTDWVLQYG